MRLVPELGSETGVSSVLGEEVGESLEGRANREGSQEENSLKAKSFLYQNRPVNL